MPFANTTAKKWKRSKSEKLRAHSLKFPYTQTQSSFCAEHSDTGENAWVLCFTMHLTPLDYTVQRLRNQPRLSYAIQSNFPFFANAFTTATLLLDHKLHATKKELDLEVHCT